MSTHDSAAAWHICQPYYDMLRMLIPAADRGPVWECLPKPDHWGLMTDRQRWRHYADTLDNMQSLAESYGANLPMRWLAADWLIECGTLSESYSINKPSTPAPCGP